MDTAPLKDISECQTRDALLRQKIVYLQLLQGVVVAANEALTVAEAMQRCLDQVCAHTGWPIGHAYLPAEDVTGILVPRTFWHLDDPGRFTPFQAIIEGTCLTPGVGLLEQVLASGKPAWIRDVTEAPHVPWAKHATDVGVKAGFAFPVLMGAKVSAVLEFFSTETGEPEAALLDVMAHMGTHLGRVIERRRAEETRAPLAAILESSDDAIIGTTLDGTLVDWNTGAERIYGYRRDEVNGRPIAILVPSDRLYEIPEILARLRRGERVEHYETVCVRKGGTLIDVSLTFSPILDLTGHIVGVSAIARDITRRKRAEEALRKRTHDLGERIKELQCLYAIAALVAKPGSSLEEICQGIVEVMPLAWRYPEIACGRIRLADRVFATQGFTETIWKQRADICVYGDCVGALEVYYLKEKSACDEGPFLKEERNLLNAIAKFLGEAIERLWAEAARTRYAAQLQALAKASLAINSAMSLAEVMRIVTEKARDIIGAHRAVMHFIEDGNWAQATTVTSSSHIYAGFREGEALPDVGLYRLVCERNRPMRITPAEIEAHPAWQRPGTDARPRPSLRGWLAAPLIGRADQNIGLIQLSDRYEGEFTEDDEAILVQLAQMASIAIEKARLFEEVHHSQEQLQALSQRLLEVQETERRSIARELHDEIGQVLTGLKLTLGMSAHVATGAADNGLSYAQTLVNDLIARVRDLSLALRPAMLDDLGLLPALLWLFERYSAQTNVQVDCKHVGLDGRRFGAAVETAAFRIVQEALTNVARHARVPGAMVRLWSDPNRLGVQIEDYGIGFDPQTASAASSGLAGMRERASALKGHLTIESAPGSGTRILAEWPLSPKGGETPWP
ncbi:MAG: PAS domain S-box protein [Candidatus Entotheonellia bacterium]